MRGPGSCRITTTSRPSPTRSTKNGCDPFYDPSRGRYARAPFRGRTLRPGRRGMYNSQDVRSPVRTPYLLLALLVAAFITLYPQLEAAGYCGEGSCPQVSHSAPAQLGS